MIVFVVGMLCGLVTITRGEKDAKKSNSCDSDEGGVYEIYMAFLKGERRAYIDKETCIDIDAITIPTGEPEKRYYTKYAIVECTGDDIPELHVQTPRTYYIITCCNKELLVWSILYPHTELLKNKAFLYKNIDENREEVYYYQMLNEKGNIVYEICFGRYSDNGKYDDESIYIYDNVEITKDIWEKLTEKYFDMIDDGVKWIELYEGLGF